MNFNNLINQFLGNTPSSTADDKGPTAGLSQTVSSLVSTIPGGLAGGAAAGGIMALLVSNKSARKFAGKAAQYGGAAMLGGLAYKAYQNWHSSTHATTQQASSEPVAGGSEASFHHQAIKNSSESQNDFELTLVKAMIAAARADGHLDAQEQQRIFQAVQKMNLSSEEKAIVFDNLQKDISIEELANGISTMELKAEIYLASCLVIDNDTTVERQHLDKLGTALALPQELLQQLELQAHQAMSGHAAW